MTKKYSGPRHPEVLHGLEEVAAYLGIDKQTVRRWIRKLEMPVAMMPGGYYWTTRPLLGSWIGGLAGIQRDMEIPEWVKAEGVKAAALVPRTRLARTVEKLEKESGSQHA